MSDFWNSRYGRHEYAYGEKPNAFFASMLSEIPAGKILCPAEGEGRNAVYAARQGFDVYAFDPSSEGRRKALSLAERFGVQIRYSLESYETARYQDGTFDAVALVFAHMPPHKRMTWHRKMAAYLKSGGMLILEGFSKKQVDFSSGGPADIAMLFSQEELMEDFAGLNVISMEEKEVELDEGNYHQGKASVICALFRN